MTEPVTVVFLTGKPLSAAFRALELASAEFNVFGQTVLAAGFYKSETIPTRAFVTDTRTHM